LENPVDTSDTVTEAAQQLDAEIRENLVEPFIAATSAALGEMGGTEVMAQSIRQQSSPDNLGDIFAVVEITSRTKGFLVLAFPAQTAAALAARMLTDVTEELDDSLIRDCVGEMANVLAGQAKALLAGGPYRFTFSIPKVFRAAESLRPVQNLNCLVIAFRCEQGEFAVQLFMHSAEQQG
jgi:chemotaxis protein CheX